MSNKHGGSRSGSGRKSKKKLFSDLSLTKKRRAFLEMISEEEVEEIVKAMMKRALLDGKEAQFIINQLIGRSLQATDITSGGKKIESFNDGQVKRIADRIASRRAGNGGSPGAKSSD